MNETRKTCARVFVDVLKSLGWHLYNGANWLADVDSGIDLEAVSETQEGDACITLSGTSAHVSVLVVDAERKSVWEFGMDYRDAENLEQILLFLARRLLSRNYADFSSWYKEIPLGCSLPVWEVQGQVKDVLTDTNVAAEQYVRPLST